MKFRSIFQNGGAVETLSLEELVGWHLHKEDGKLLLPPIQRSLVWSNSQIIDYWDSLLRGYPSGMIMVHRPKPTGDDPQAHGRDEMGETRPASGNDWQLFDGQQRLSSILLGLGQGTWPATRKLWIDVAKTPSRPSGLKFQLRISSNGQPFGYRLEAPNQKLELRKRQQKWAEWKQTNPNIHEAEAFLKVRGQDLIDAERAIPLSDICASVRQSVGFAPAPELSDAESSCLDEFIEAVRRLFKSEIVVRLVDDEIVDHPDEYVRFFGRIGQGGTALSNDEFTYSMIKYRYPSVHDRIQHVMAEAGRLAGEVDLVLGALRVAKMLAPREQAERGRILSRPTPEFVSELDTWAEAQRRFLSLMSYGGMLPAEGRGELEQALIAVRHALAYSDDNPNGLPPMLLARFPRELVDVLILLGVKSGSGRHWSWNDQRALQAFTFHWLLFVTNNEKAAWEVFEQALDPTWDFSQSAAQKLIAAFEKKGFALFMPRPESVLKLKRGLSETASVSLLRSWAERFTAVDQVDAHNPGHTLRVISTNIELIKRALMWLQRDYLIRRFPHYDPTSSRDEDLPVDLDHIIPQSLFGDDWRLQQGRLDSSVDGDNFRNQRHNLGNSLGNYRWLCASENRRRKAGGLSAGRRDDPVSLQLDERQDAHDLISNPVEWNGIIPEQKDGQLWSASDVAKFQFLIDMRTLDLYESLLTAMEVVMPDEATA